MQAVLKHSVQELTHISIKRENVLLCMKPRKMTLTFFYILTIKLEWKQNNILRKIYDKVTEGIFDMINVRFFKEIGKKKMGMFILCYFFGRLSLVKRLA